ncbi:MAG TPA: hypothetical protein DDW89_10545, partial [Gammaproteobacteria bacterium]|nr:hypothetical protein [Gammaproteobacteria bacterium]
MGDAAGRFSAFSVWPGRRADAWRSTHAPRTGDPSGLPRNHPQQRGCGAVRPDAGLGAHPQPARSAGGEIPPARKPAQRRERAVRGQRTDRCAAVRCVPPGARVSLRTRRLRSRSAVDVFSHAQPRRPATRSASALSCRDPAFPAGGAPTRIAVQISAQLGPETTRMTVSAERPLPLSVAIIARNEEARLPRCLESVSGLAAEIVVLDSGSADATVAVAERFGARVEITDWPGFTVQKNRALVACHQPWVLSLDADEAVSPALADAIRALFAAGDPPRTGYFINRRNRYLGVWLRHAWTPEWRLRLVARDQARWTGGRVHEQLTVTGPTGRLAGDLLHESYDRLDDHLHRTIAYARL